MEDKKERGGHGILIGAFVLLFVYFFCPFLIITPIFLVAKAAGVPPEQMEKAELFFAPIDYLYRKVPIYHSMLETEKELMRKFIGDPFR